MSDIILRFFLSFSSESIILPMTLLGYTFSDRRKWGTAIYILLFTIIFAKFLKNIWQIPLPAHVSSNSYAFPSGHMQGTAVFYGWVLLQCRSKFVTTLCFIIMLGVAGGLLHFNYHIPRDIFGALGFALITIILYHFILTKFFVNNVEMSGLLLAVIGFFMICKLPIMNILWLAEGALVGFSIGWMLAKSAPIPLGIWNGIMTLITAGAGIGITKFLAGTAGIPTSLIVFITYAFIGFWISFCPQLINMCNKLKLPTL